MNLDDLTPEQKQRAKELKTPEELIAFTEEVGLELSSEELEAIAGGEIYDQCDTLNCKKDSCPHLKCGVNNCSVQRCPRVESIV